MAAWRGGLKLPPGTGCRYSAAFAGTPNLFGNRARRRAPGFLPYLPSFPRKGESRGGSPRLWDYKAVPFRIPAYAEGR